MKIVNKTHFETKDLRAVLQRCAEMELDGPHRKRLRVTIVYGRRGFGCGSGYAYLNSGVSRMRLPKDGVDPVKFAILACHEFAHNRGMRHRMMPEYYKGWPVDHPRYAWAKALTIRVRPEKKRPTFRSLEPTVKHAHAMKMHAKALTRLKRAQTIEKKWRTKVRYYEKISTAVLDFAAKVKG